jgi:uncharacterized spore protein YtfJ
LQNSASVKTVYGDPITAEGKTIIPVAKVTYGFGAGNAKRDENEERTEGKETAVGGGGIYASPVGLIEITEAETRFIPIGDRRKLAGALLVGLFLGLWLASRRSRK